MGRVSYRTFYIKDSKIENISCIFFDFINHLEAVFAFSEDARVLIHCVLGVSRSVTLSMAFLMHSYKMTFRHCFNFVKDKRGVASPNLGFVSQLLDFEKRINTVPNPPKSGERSLWRVFVFGGHQREDPEYYVFRSVDPKKMLLSLQKPSIRDQSSGFMLDPRGALVLVADDPKCEKSAFLWIGRRANPRQDVSFRAAQQNGVLSPEVQHKPP